MNTEAFGGTVIAVFLVFCRIGSCLMLMPGFSSSRVPVQVRLFLAVAVTLAIAPLIVAKPWSVQGDARASALFLAIGVEITLGLFIGLVGRIFFAALQFSAVAIASFAGLGGLSGTPAIDNEPMPALSTLVVTMATVLIFVTDQHLEVIRALVSSYSVIPMGQMTDSVVSLQRLERALIESFVLGLQISAPFVIYSLAVNMLFGLANKMNPQIPVYFISLPFVIAGGLLLAFWTFHEALPLFMDAFGTWLKRG